MEHKKVTFANYFNQVPFSLNVIQEEASAIADAAAGNTNANASTDFTQSLLSLTDQTRTKIKAALSQVNKKKRIGVPDGAIIKQLETAIGFESDPSSNLDDVIRILNSFLDLTSASFRKLSMWQPKETTNSRSALMASLKTNGVQQGRPKQASNPRAALMASLKKQENDF